MKDKNLFWIFLITFIVSVTFSLKAQLNDWNVPMGGNSARNGLSHHLGPLVEPGGEPELYWSGGEAAVIGSIPAIEGDKLILSRRWPSASQTESWIVCYNVYDGTELWKVTLPLDPESDHYAKVSGVDSEHVYASRAGGYYSPSWLIALDIETGEVVWQSEDKVTEYDFETATFRDNGDLIIGNQDEILCISKNNGSTVWVLDRETWSGGDGSSVAAYGNRGYYWDQAPGTVDMVVSACDLETGEHLFYSDAISSSSMQAQQSGLLVGPDGTVYAPRSNSIPEFDSIVSLSDKGDHFEENWRYAIGFINFCTHGVGPDNTVYTYSRDEEVVRLDPETGEVLNTSIVIAGDEMFFTPWIAIGDDGMVYLTVEDYPIYKLYFFTPELELLWSEEIYKMRGVALGDSVLVVNATGTEIRAYKGRPNPGVGIKEPNVDESFAIYPNPTNGIFNITFNTNLNSKDVLIDIINISGMIVYSTILTSGFETSLRVDLSEQNDGIYVLRYFEDNEYHFQKIIKQ